jgi:hypothetical protein
MKRLSRRGGAAKGNPTGRQPHPGFPARRGRSNAVGRKTRKYGR